MTIKKGEILEAIITDLAFGGRGLARIDGMVVFVDPAVPEIESGRAYSKSGRAMPRPG